MVYHPYWAIDVDIAGILVVRLSWLSKDSLPAEPAPAVQVYGDLVSLIVVPGALTFRPHN